MRLKKMLIFVFNCINENTRNLGDLYTIRNNGYSLRDKSLFIERFNTVKYGKMSLKYAGTKLWNSLPSACKNCQDVNEFKRVINKWNCQDYKCQSCLEFLFHCEQN
jgi:hypothetical protein